MMNNKIKNARGFKGQEAFGKLTESGTLPPMSNIARVLCRFPLVYCGHEPSFQEFSDSKRTVQGIKALVHAIQEIAKRSSTVDESDNQVALDEADFKDDSYLFVTDVG